METDKRAEALAKFLQVNAEEITKERENEYSAEGGEYLVLTDEEADKAAADYIKDSVWAFNASFIIEHSKALDFEAASEKIVQAIQEQCESGNEAMTKLIDNIDEFIADAISAAGRGHFLSGYNGNEGEEGEFFIYRTN